MSLLTNPAVSHRLKLLKVNGDTSEKQKLTTAETSRRNEVTKNCRRATHTEGTKFLYDIAFGIKPRHFSAGEEENVIYDEEDEVLEMYFITSGSIGVGYHLYQ